MLHRHAGAGSASRRSSAAASPASTAPAAAPPVTAASTPPTSPQQNALGRALASCAAALVLGAGAPFCLLPPRPAHALLNSPNARIPRTAEAALRRSIPAFNQSVLTVQKKVEDVQYLLRIPQRKPWGTMASDVDAALALVAGASGGEGGAALSSSSSSSAATGVTGAAGSGTGTGTGTAAVATAVASSAAPPAVGGPALRLLEGVPDGERARGEQALRRLKASLGQLKQAVAAQQADWAGARAADALKATADLELLQAPNLAFQLPPQYAEGRPVLRGRAVVRLEVSRGGDGAPAFADDEKGGGLASTGIAEITLDGYSAPLTAGRLAANVRAGMYDNTRVAASFASVLVGPGADAKFAVPPAPVPLELLPAGAFDPVYRLPLDVAGGELPVLPLSVEGAVGLARLPDGDPAFFSGSQFFVGKFDKSQAGLSGLAFDEGSLPVAGYVTRGYDSVLRRLRTGDVIVSARIVEGGDRLVVPAAEAGAAGPAVAGG